MKILFLTRLYWPHVGGVENHVSEIGKWLKVKGENVTVITSKHDKKLKIREKKNGIEIVRFEQPKIKYFGLLYTWFWFLKNLDLIKDSDVIHCHDVFIWYLPFRFIFPKKKVYTTFHGWEGIYPIPGKNILQKRIASMLSSKTIAVGRYIGKYYGIKPDVVTFGAVNMPNKAEDKAINSIVYVGRLEEDTGLTVFLKVLSSLEGFKVDFCGEGELANECLKYGRVHGFVNPTPFLKKSQICFASGYLTILEAMAHRCLVLTAYDNPLKKDYYRQTPFKNWIISSDNSAEITEVIKAFTKNEKEFSKMINEGYNWVKSQSWEKLSKQYLALWEAETLL